MSRREAEHAGSHNRTMSAAQVLEPAAPNRAVGSFEAPFDMLDACHARLRTNLGLLTRLTAHLRAQGSCSQAGAAACSVMRYFDIAARLHHQDEERHVFPRLEASGEVQLVALAKRLRGEHRQIEHQWGLLWPMLEQVARHRSLDLAELAVTCQRFVQLHQAHLADEEQVAYPSAQIALACEGGDALRRMGEEMGARRGLALLP